MVNSADFTKRLQQILDYYDLSAAAFADAIDVGRSSISHILSGRNKPSLDFVLKIVQSYPDVELYWLLNGKGNFPASSKKEEAKETFPLSAKESAPQKEKRPENAPEMVSKIGKAIKRIVIFYDDGSFEAFES